MLGFRHSLLLPSILRPVSTATCIVLLVLSQGHPVRAQAAAAPAYTWDAIDPA